MTERIEAQIERFAPGFRDLILARSTFTAVDTEEHNPSYVGGDINAGAATLRQMVLRPTPRWNPYRTALRGVYLCSAATPPGGGVHGMCGLGAARAALHDLGHRTYRGRDLMRGTTVLRLVPVPGDLAVGAVLLLRHRPPGGRAGWLRHGRRRRRPQHGVLLRRLRHQHPTSRSSSSSTASSIRASGSTRPTTLRCCGRCHSLPHVETGGEHRRAEPGPASTPRQPIPATTSISSRSERRRTRLHRGPRQHRAGAAWPTRTRPTSSSWTPPVRRRSATTSARWSRWAGYQHTDQLGQLHPQLAGPPASGRGSSSSVSSAGRPPPSSGTRTTPTASRSCCSRRP